VNIVFAAPAYKPAHKFGGGVTAVADMAEHLAKRGHKVKVFTSSSNVDELLDVPCGVPVDVESVEVHYFKPYSLLKKCLSFIPYVASAGGLLYCPGIREALEREAPNADLFHLHLPFNYPCYAAGHTALKFKKPLFYHQHAALLPEYLKFRTLKKLPYLLLAEKPMLRKATTLFALTSYEEESYRALGLNTPCKVIPNGIDREKFRTRPVGELPKALREIPGNAKLILFMARLHPIKGADLLLKAFLRIGKERPDAFLVLAGPDVYNLQAGFIALAKEAGLEKQVLFPGMVSGEDKLNLLARADIFCLPSQAEGFSMTVLEAMASKTALLLSTGCHFPEAEAKGAGWELPLDEAKWADKLSWLLQNHGKTLKAAESAYILSNDYSWNSIVERLEAVYIPEVERNSNF